MASLLKDRAIAKLKKEIIDKDGFPIMSPAALKLACMEHDGYETPELNEKLFLHFKGFRKIESLAPYSALKTLFLESNGIQSISGLETCVNLRSLYLQQNGITKIENLSTLCNLKTINLSQNRITKVENLSGLLQLETLNLNKNCLGGENSMNGLLECPTITNLDVTSNDLEEPNILNEVLIKMPKLSCLYLKGNGLVRQIKSYRKTLITSLPRLAYLDDRPIFELERVAAAAWKVGGTDAEREARQTFHQNKSDKDRQQRVNFKKWKAERRQKRLDEIAKAKAEGRELPKPKCFVRYSTVSKEEVEKDKRKHWLIQQAEQKALNDPSNGIAGESTATIQECGRKFAEECGAKFDENGQMIEAGKTDDSPKSTSKGDLGIVKKDHHFAEGYMDMEEKEEQEERQQQMQLETSVGQGETKQSAPSLFAPPPPAPSTSSSVALATPSTAVAKEEVVEEEVDPLDVERRKAVEDSMAIYRERNKARKAAKKDGPSMDLSERNAQQSSARTPSSREMDAMHILNMEYKSMTTTQQSLLNERIQEAEEEEENYRNERAKMKAMGSARKARMSAMIAKEKKKTLAADVVEEEQELWNKNLDERVQELTRKHLFDFNAVAKDMGNAFTMDECRLRFALLASNGGVAPAKKVAAASTSSMRLSRPTPIVASTAETKVRKTAAEMYRSETTTTTKQLTSASSTYTPWSPTATSSTGDFYAKDTTALSSATTSVTAPPPAANDSVFNSKIMRIRPVTVNLDALPSMMDDSDEDDNSDDGGDDATLTTDVDAMD
jgi:hypothetical protein